MQTENYRAAIPHRCNRPGSGEMVFTVHTSWPEDQFPGGRSENNYILYVTEGQKRWHTSQTSYELQPGSCIFIRRGVAMEEQLAAPGLRFYLFFVSDDFIAEVLKTKTTALHVAEKKYEALIPVQCNDVLHYFFKSMQPYTNAAHMPDQSLLQLKFRELILTLADNTAHQELLSYFNSLLRAPKNLTLQTVMEDNFSCGLKLEDFARLSYRSLSTFKRDFVRFYNTSPGKWLVEKRLHYAKHLIISAGKSVTDAAFESGFENGAHFSRAFSKLFGSPPSSMKKANCMLN